MGIVRLFQLQITGISFFGVFVNLMFIAARIRFCSVEIVATLNE